MRPATCVKLIAWMRPIHVINTKASFDHEPLLTGGRALLSETAGRGSPQSPFSSRIFNCLNVTCHLRAFPEGRMCRTRQPSNVRRRPSTSFMAIMASGPIERCDTAPSDAYKCANMAQLLLDSFRSGRTERLARDAVRRWPREEFWRLQPCGGSFRRFCGFSVSEPTPVRTRSRPFSTGP